MAETMQEALGGGSVAESLAIPDTSVARSLTSPLALYACTVK